MRSRGVFDGVLEHGHAMLPLLLRSRSDNRNFSCAAGQCGCSWIVRGQSYHHVSSMHGIAPHQSRQHVFDSRHESRLQCWILRDFFEMQDCDTALLDGLLDEPFDGHVRDSLHAHNRAKRLWGMTIERDFDYVRTSIGGHEAAQGCLQRLAHGSNHCRLPRSSTTVQEERKLRVRSWHETAGWTAEPRCQIGAELLPKCRGERRGGNVRERCNILPKTG